MTNPFEGVFCPYCRYSHDGSVDIDSGKMIKPKMGDYSICVNCVQVSIYNERLELVKANLLFSSKLLREWFNKEQAIIQLGKVMGVIKLKGEFVK